MVKRHMRSWIGVSCAVALVGAAPAWAGEIYGLNAEDIWKHKATYDDPRPLFKDFGLKKALPADVYKKLTYDPDAMKKAWANVVGFKAPDVVGKISPDVKSGTYGQKDREKLKELMIPELYERFKPGAPPYAGNFGEIKVIPTRQYYYALPIAEATEKNEGKTKLDDKGYLVASSYVAGFPFPRPDGKWKPQQIMFNWEKRYVNWESAVYFLEARGFTKSLGEDFDSAMSQKTVRLESRVQMDPRGSFDGRAKSNGEGRHTINVALSPRDLAGNTVSVLSYADRDQADQFMMYISAIRRAKKLSSGDTQDAMGGQDLIYVDGDGFNQKLSPDKYPYKFEVIAEREYLVPAFTMDGSGYLSSKTKEFVDYEFERRPLYVLKLTQLDSNFVYSKRILYIDKETFTVVFVENYDQKGRLFRTALFRMAFFPESGMFSLSDMLARDHVDHHSTYERAYVVPAPGLDRNDISMKAVYGGR